jgi:hypothetical protein
MFAHLRLPLRGWHGHLHGRRFCIISTRRGFSSGRISDTTKAHVTIAPPLDEQRRGLAVLSRIIERCALPPQTLERSVLRWLFTRIVLRGKKRPV